MNYPVKVYQLARDARPDERAELIAELAVSADTVDGAWGAARARLEADGRQVRCLSFTTDGQIAAVVTPPAPPVPPPRAARRPQGAR